MEMNQNDSKKSCASRMTKAQKEYLIGYIEKNKNLLNKNKLTPTEYTKYELCWNFLANELNKLEGASKQAKHWREVSTDLI